MGFRFRVCKGVTVGRSGFRFGTKIGKTYISSGRSGTLVAGKGWRYFHHNNPPKATVQLGSSARYGLWGGYGEPGGVPELDTDGSDALVALFWGCMIGLLLSVMLFS